MVEDIERVLMLDKLVKLIHNGLSISIPTVSPLSICSRISWYSQDIKCEGYQLAVQSLSADTKLHMLFGEMRHEGENVMDYKASFLESTLEADTDMSILEEEDTNNIHSNQNKADFYCSAEVKGNKGSNTMEDDDDNPDWENDKDHTTEYKYIKEDGNEINNGGVQHQRLE